MLAEVWKKIIGRETQPEFLAAVQVLARLGRDFADRLALDRTFKIDHRKIFHLQSALRNIDKVRCLIAQPVQRRVYFRLRHFRLRQLHGNVFIFRQLELRRGHDGGAKPHRPVLAELDLFQVGQRNDTQLLLRNRIVITFRDELFRQLILNFLAKLRFDDAARGFARPVTGNPGKSGEAICDRVPFLRNLFRRQFDL